MKALTFNILLVIIIISVAVVAGIFIISQVYKADIASFLSSSFLGCGDVNQKCCPEDWCKPDLVCQNNICIEEWKYEISLDKTFLINNSFITRAQRDDYFDFMVNDEDCSKGLINCMRCSKITNFTNAQTCSMCDVCDPDESTCEVCLFCDSSSDNAQNLFECHDCDGCTVNDVYMADSCNSCSWCNAANETTYENGLECNYCSFCNNTDCWSCYDCNNRLDKACDFCDRSPNTECEKKSEYDLCQKVKECIAYYEGEPCNVIEDIEDFLPFPLEGIDYADKIKNILSNCVEGDVMRYLPEGGRQKVCKYINPNFEIKRYDSDAPNFSPPPNFLTMIESESVTGENEGTLFWTCGIKEPFSYKPTNPTIFYADPITFDSSTTPSTPEGDTPINVKLVVSDVLWNEGGDNNCFYNFYICPQEAIAKNEDDKILKFYETFAKFNESNYPIQTKKWKYSHVNVTGIKFLSPITINGSKNFDAAHIAKSIIAGIRDWFLINFDNNRTIKFLCVNSGLHPSLDDCINNETSFYLNDKTTWKIEEKSILPDTLSSPRKYKYVYWKKNTNYNDEVNVGLTFYVITNDQTGSWENQNNTIFVTPTIVFEGDVS